MKEIIIAAMSIVGVLVGFALSERKSGKEQKMYKESLWLELEDIRDGLASVLESLLNEFKNPIRNNRVKPLEVDWDYVNELQKGLGANIPFPVRKALKEMKLLDKVATSVINKKNESAIQRGEGKVVINYQLCSLAIVETCKLLYVICKLLETRENYKRSIELDTKDIIISVFKRIDRYSQISDVEVRKICNSAPR
ncbi:TPA: hypothetical protein ACPJ06_003968 [Vibrio diabolicus]|uniref:hypothetical protein n=1 Tax=Vibrio TaxID=662 RepID=UPI00215CAE16|nr:MULTISPECIES: hypothetical protein [Vibrio]EJN3360478.1 hypothetical protein [Vibrio alginolyticus]MCR9320556.1 hypothetical protein [Vibrio alginolyticus]MDW1837429.1 hypothetical protein [Vibrio sp. Vb0718]